MPKNYLTYKEPVTFQLDQKRQWTDTVSQVTQMLKLSQTFEAAMMKMLQEVKMNTLETNGQQETSRKKQKMEKGTTQKFQN